MCDIDLSGFTWDTAATFSTAAAALLTGLLAVRAAKSVGLKQVAITNKMAEFQKAIGKEQVANEAAKLRADLFDRRMKAYETCVETLNLANDGVAYMQNYQPLFREFIKVSREVGFLFQDEEIHKAVEEIRINCCRIGVIIKSMRQKWDYKPGNQQASLELDELQIWQNSMMEKLPDIFRKDLEIMRSVKSLA